MKSFTPSQPAYFMMKAITICSGKEPQLKKDVRKLKDYHGKLPPVGGCSAKVPPCWKGAKRGN